MSSLKEKAKTLEVWIKEICHENWCYACPISKHHNCDNLRLIRLEDAQKDKQDTLERASSLLEDECKRIQDEIDRGCYSNPLDIIFEVHKTISEYFEWLLKVEKEAKP
jgi:hypothetical protein